MYFLPVYPLGTILTIGITAEDSDTWLKPIARAMLPISFSWASYLVQNNVQINNCEIWKKHRENLLQKWKPFTQDISNWNNLTKQLHANNFSWCWSKQTLEFLLVVLRLVLHDQRRIKHQRWHFNLYLLHSTKQLEISSYW